MCTCQRPALLERGRPGDRLLREAVTGPPLQEQRQSVPAAGFSHTVPILPSCRPLRCSHPAMQVAEWGPKIEGIVEWFGQLQGVDVEGVPPALRADVEAAPALRPDVVTRQVAGSDLLQQAADREGPFVR